MEKWYFHGTTPKRARLIRREGFKIGPIMLPGEDEPYYLGYGNIGYGTYISENWKVAIWFGYSLLRIRLEPGTRLLTMPPEPDPKILKYLKREFGKDILNTDRLDRILPHNKRLTLKEHVAVLGYHYREVGRYFWSPDRGLNSKKRKSKRKHVKAMHCIGADLRRFGIHGYGEPQDFNGIVVFEPSKLILDKKISIDKDIWMEKVSCDGYSENSLKSGKDLGIDPEELNMVQTD